MSRTYLFFFFESVEHLCVGLLNQSLVDLGPISPSMLIELLLEQLLRDVIV